MCIYMYLLISVHMNRNTLRCKMNMLLNTSELKILLFVGSGGV